MMTALDCAASEGHREICEILIENKCPVDPVDNVAVRI